MADRFARCLEHLDADLVLAHYGTLGVGVGVPAARRLARERLSASLAALSAEFDAELGRLFREHLGQAIVAVSPLVAAACRVEGLELDQLVEGFRHDGPSRAWLMGPSPMPPGGRPGAQRVTLGELRTLALVRRFERPGIVVREEGRPGGALGVRARNGCLELVARTGRMDLTTSAGRAVLTLRRAVPETLRLAVGGRLLDEVVDLPLTNGRGHRIERAIEGRGGGTALVFRAEPLPWRLPWAREWLRDTAGGAAGRDRG